MSAPMKDGGPAFPRPDFHSDTHYTEKAQDGMTLRDYFAAQAIPQIYPPNNFDYNEVAGVAYAIADAMLKAREFNQ